MILGALASLTIVLTGIWFDPFNFPAGLGFSNRVELFSPWLLCLAFPLLVSILRVAKYRFFHKAVLNAGSQVQHKFDRELSILQSLLTNTMEQSLLALLIYFVWLSLCPSEDLSVICLAAASFLLGRTLFFIGYKSGASSRALGFVLTFYPHVILAIYLLSLQIYTSIHHLL